MRFMESIWFHLISFHRFGMFHPLKCVQQEFCGSDICLEGVKNGDTWRNLHFFTVDSEQQRNWHQWTCSRFKCFQMPMAAMCSGHSDEERNTPKLANPKLIDAFDDSGFVSAWSRWRWACATLNGESYDIDSQCDKLNISQPTAVTVRRPRPYTFHLANLIKPGSLFAPWLSWIEDLTEMPFRFGNLLTMGNCSHVRILETLRKRGANQFCSPKGEWKNVALLGLEKAVG